MATDILYVIDKLENGGTERQLIQLIHNLDRNRYRPHLCTFATLSEDVSGIDICNRVTLPFRGFADPSICVSVGKLVAYIRAHGIKIVQTFFQDPCLLAVLSKPFHSAKLVGSFRDLGFWKTSWESRKMRFGYPFFSRFIANSQAVKTHFVVSDAIPPDKVHVVYNGIAVDKENRQQREGGTPVVGIVANCNREVKRVDDFIQIAAIVAKCVPMARFLVVGGGHLLPRLQEMAGTLGMNGALEFTGRVTDPLSYIRTFTIGLITSESEGFSNAILEYMTCGVPVVATATGGNPELVEDGVNGYLAPVGDVALMARKIIDLINNRELQKKISQNNITKIDSCFSIERMVENTQEIYDTLSC